MMSHPLLPKLRQLRLSGILNTLEVRVSQAVDQQLAPLEFLALLLDDELERRNQNRLVLKLALSGCDSNKTLAHFDFSAAPGINRTLIQDLASCVFIQHHENLLMCGPTGVGKSHLANAIAIEALKRNFRVLAKPPHRLLQDLQIARANGSHPRILARTLAYDLLVLDEVLVAIHKGLITTQAVLDLMAARPDAVELVLTGRDAPPEIVARADLVTEMRMIKHPFQKGIAARAGIEY